ncbi:YgiQ family radical SAM protein [Rhodocyclaceae bacterium Wk13]|uniref:YgiQ family radical SAM protein n=2 Tax=Dentiradicibacter hellwigii TaxID=3149053 RepID=A0ABV4UE20_9RHOO
MKPKMPNGALPKPLFSYRPYWAKRFGIAPFLPMSREEMEALGWDSCDVIIVSGDAYIDHPSFSTALIGRLLEAQGFRVGIIAQPDWHSAEPFRVLGRPNLFFGVSAGNMDSMVNRYTADRKIRSDDAYTPDGAPNRRPDRAVIVYAQRCREAYPEANVVIGAIEASLRRVAHYDYWSDTVRRSVLPDAKADLLVYGNAERAMVALAHRLAMGEPIAAIRDLRGTAFMTARGWLPADDWTEIDSTRVDTPGRLDRPANPYGETVRQDCPAMAKTAESSVPYEKAEKASVKKAAAQPLIFYTQDRQARRQDRGSKSAVESGKAENAGHIAARSRTVIRLPSYEQVRDDPVLYAHASRTLHLESNPGNARALVQAHGARDVWLNPPPIPLTTAEMDGVYDLPFQRKPHPAYGQARIPAYEMIRFSINIMRGCFGGCTFCSITEHEGRIIQSRSEASVLREIEDIRDKTPGFTGIISDLGGPTANMYRMACRDKHIESACRRLSCVFPDICHNLITDHAPLIDLYRKARAVPGVKRILISSGLRYDLAVRSPEYIRELVAHHVGGYLKIAPEHTEPGPLAYMMKPGIGAYDQFKRLFDKASRDAGKEQYLIPYFIAAHPGTGDEDMLNLSLWLKRNGFRLDQVQTFLPTPMALATTMFRSGRNPLKKVTRDAPRVSTVRGARQRRLHKAFLRYHDPDNWPLLRETLKQMGRADLIGNGKRHLVPNFQPAETGDKRYGNPIKKLKMRILPPRGGRSSK